MITEDRTKRLLVCLCAVAAGIAVAAPSASALFELDFNGHVRGKPNSYVGFNVKTTASGKRKATSFTSQGLPYKCDNGSMGKTQFLTLDDPLTIVSGTIDGKSHVFTPQGDPVARVFGRLEGGTAHGTLRLTGRLDPSDSSAKCEASSRKWVAERAPQPAP
jgi:hypothetical protein